jgi:hypothetical protein
MYNLRNPASPVMRRLILALDTALKINNCGWPFTGSLEILDEALL